MYYLLSQARFFLNYLSFLFLSLFMFSLCASYQYMYIHTHTYIQLVFIVDIGGRHYCRNYSHFTPGRTDLQQDRSWTYPGVSLNHMNIKQGRSGSPHENGRGNGFWVGKQDLSMNILFGFNNPMKPTVGISSAHPLLRS